MTGKTHRAGGILISVVGFSILRQKGLLLPNVNEGLQWLVMYPFCMYGSVMSDLDHHWESCPSKDIVSRVINGALHATKPLVNLMDKFLSEKQKKKNYIYKLADVLNAKHRSWQTHSDVTLIIMIWLLLKITSGNFLSFSEYDLVLFALVISGLCLGVIAHFILDSITPEGIKSVLLEIIKKITGLKIPTSIHFVPHKEFFATGGKWEMLIQKLLNVATVIAVIWLGYVLLQPYLPYNISFGG